MLQPPNKKIRGKIMLALLGECKTTEQIVYEIDESPDDVLPNLIRLRHLGIMQPVAICVDDAPFDQAVDYTHNLLWEMTEHGRYHDTVVDGCYGCKMRERLMALEVVLIE